MRIVENEEVKCSHQGYVIEAVYNIICVQRRYDANRVYCRLVWDWLGDDRTFDILDLKHFPGRGRNRHDLRQRAAATAVSHQLSRDQIRPESLVHRLSGT